MAESKIEEVARALCRQEGENPDLATPHHPRVKHLWEHYIPSARAAIEAMALEQMLMSAYVRGVEWNEENPLDWEYRFKAAGDYADKTLFAALSEEVAG